MLPAYMAGGRCSAAKVLAVCIWHQQTVTMHMQLVRAYLDTAVANNLNVMRIWAQTVGFNRAPFQTSPGVYNENIFRGLDYALDQARQRDIKVGNCASHSVSLAALLSPLFVALLPDFSPVEPLRVFSSLPACPSFFSSFSH